MNIPKIVLGKSNTEMIYLLTDLNSFFLLKEEIGGITYGIFW